MEKIKLQFKLPETKTFEYSEGVTIEVVPFLTTAQQTFIISQYIEDMFNSAPEENPLANLETNVLVAEFNLRNYVYQAVSNIDVEDMDANLYSDNFLWQGVTDLIVNYWEFIGRLSDAVEAKWHEKDLETSVGTVLEGLVSRGYELLEEFAKIDPQVIQDGTNAILESVDKLEKSSVLRKATEDVSVQKANASIARNE